MKKIFQFLLFLIPIIACSNNNAKDSKNISSAEAAIVKSEAADKNVSAVEGGRYGIKSARVVTVTALPGGMGSTVTTLYFDNYGKDNFTETVSNITMKGVPAQPKQYSMIKEEYIYSWTEGKTDGTKIKMSLGKDLRNIDYEKLGKEMSDQFKIKKVGNESFLGKNCEAYEMNNAQLGKGKILTWKNIPMLSDITTMGMNVKAEVKELEENPSVDPSKFKIPEGIEFREMSMKTK